jgi:hypothetical protein
MPLRCPLSHRFFPFTEGNILGEVISCTICANVYVVGDRGNMVNVPGRADQVRGVVLGLGL